MISRTEWGAKPPKSVKTDNTTVGLAIHYSAGRQALNHEECFAQVRAIQTFHMVERGWQDIAYNFLVCGHGNIFVGRGWGVRDAAQGTLVGNDTFHSVCWLGGPGDQVNDLTISALHTLYEESKRLGYGSEIKPHSDFKVTQCPGNDMRFKLDRIKEEVKPLANQKTSNPAFQAAFDAAVDAGMFTQFTNVDDIITAEKLAVFLQRLKLI